MGYLISAKSRGLGFMSEINDSTSGSVISPNPLLLHQLSSDSGLIAALLHHNPLQHCRVMGFGLSPPPPSRKLIGPDSAWQVLMLLGSTFVALELVGSVKRGLGGSGWGPLVQMKGNWQQAHSFFKGRAPWLLLF